MPEDEQPAEALVAALVESISGRTQLEADRLASAVMRRHWPDGGSDRSNPAARDWVRRWGPKRPVHVLPGCSCARGACGLCN